MNSRIPNPTSFGTYLLSLQERVVSSTMVMDKVRMTEVITSVTFDAEQECTRGFLRTFTIVRYSRSGSPWLACLPLVHRHALSPFHSWKRYVMLPRRDVRLRDRV